MQLREHLENGNLYLEKPHAWLLITTDWRWIINVNSREYGYHQFIFTKEQLETYGDVDRQKLELERKYNELIKWLSDF
jgi:hypothetical protein